MQGASGVSMQLDRRSAAQGIAAGILAIPAASFATSGDFPKVGGRLLKSNSWWQ
jgi:hypothetical protein